MRKRELQYKSRVVPHPLVITAILFAFCAAGSAASKKEKALLAAADTGDFEEVQKLVGKGVSVNIVDETQTTPLHWATFRGHTEIVDFLIENGALVNTVDNAGFSPLDSAAEEDHVKIARSLIRAGATVNIRNVEGRTPLYAAASEGSLAVVRLVLGAGADPDARYPPDDGTPIIIASGFGFADIVQQLIQSDANWNATTRTGNFPLLLAAQEGHTEVVEILLKAGINVNRAKNDGSVSIMIASQNGHLEIVKMLLEAGANPSITNDFGDTALHKAPVRFDDPKMIEELVKAGADIDAADTRGDTPLHMAAQFGAIESTKALLDEGADPLLPNFDLELPEDVICECLEFVMFPESLQCPEDSCSKEAIKSMKDVLTAAGSETDNGE